MQSKYDRNNCHRVVGVHEGLCNECLDVSEKVTLLFGYKIWISGTISQSSGNISIKWSKTLDIDHLISDLNYWIVDNIAAKMQAEAYK